MKAAIPAVYILRILYRKYKQLSHGLVGRGCEGGEVQNNSRTRITLATN